MKIHICLLIVSVFPINEVRASDLQSQIEDRYQPFHGLISSFRYEREILDLDGDGWCDLWCAVNQYEPNKSVGKDTDGDGVSDYDEMIHWRDPFVKGPMEHTRSDAEIVQLRKSRITEALMDRAPKKILPSNRWKSEDQRVDFNYTQQDYVLKAATQASLIAQTSVVCDPNSDLAADNDADGLTNLQEMAQGLPPCGPNTNTIPPISQVMQEIGGAERMLLSFRALELPDLTYGYQIEESADLENWNDVNMYANRLGIVNATEGVHTIDVVSVYTNLTQANWPRVFMRLKLAAPWPPQPLQFAYVPLNDLVPHIRDNVLSILPDNIFHKGIYDVYSSSGAAQWARFSWTNRLDLRGVAFDDGRTCTLISPRHVLMAAHYPRGIGETIRFHTSDGQLVTRIIIDRKFTESITNGTPYCSTGRDISVALLDEAVTDVPYYRVLPPRSDWPTYLTDSLAIVTRFNNREVLVRRTGYFSNGANGTRHVTFSLDTEVPSFYEGGVSGGDSGNPSFLLIRGEPILSHILSCSDTRGPFLGDPEIFNTINQFMSDLGGGHQLTSIYINP